MFLFLLLAVICITAFSINDTIVSNEVPLNVSGGSFKELIINNWAAILSFVLYALWEFALGETSKIKANSTIRWVYDLIMRFLKKKAIKVIIIATVFGCSVVGLNAQTGNPWKGFFKPKNECFAEQKYSLTVDSSTTTTTVLNVNTFKFRAAATVSGFAVPFNSTEAVSSFQIAGMGLSYGYYTSTTYCKYAVNAFIVSNLKLGDLTSAKAGGLVTAGFFNNYLNIGIMYACPDTQYNFYLTTGLTYTF